jgi:phage/plasmid-associated DNA primase
MPIRQEHLEEWVKGSGVGEAIANLNVESLDDSQEIDKRLNRNNKRRTKHTDWGTGGWYVSGVDPLTGEKHGIGGQFKPDQPRVYAGKPIKYESASDSEAVPLFLDTGDRNYWPNILAGTEAIVITEGAKKAGAGLTAGVPTISLSGVCNGQKQGRLKEYLHCFCQLGRRVYLCFDSDIMEKPPVRKALDTLGRLIAETGATVSVINLPEATKGLDDFVVTNGHQAFHDLIKGAKTFEEWRKMPYELDIKQLATEEDRCFTQIACESLYADKTWICINDLLHYWTGTHYEPSPDPVERKRIWQFCNKHAHISDDGYKVKLSYKHASPAVVNRVLEWVKQGHSINPEHVNPIGLNLANGVLMISWEDKQPRWELRSHHPELIYTYISKVAYDPKADPEPADRLLVALDPDQREVFLKTTATAFDMPGVRKRLTERLRVLLLQGDGSNGKDTLREAISNIFVQGLTGCTLRDFQQYDEGRKFPLAKLAYSRINWASENHSNLSLDRLQVLKSIVTGDMIDIEPKSQDEYSISPACVVLLNCNEAPNILAAQEAIKSRYCIIKFTKSFTSKPTDASHLPADPRFKNDPEFIQQHVCPGLLNYLLDALARLMAEGIDYAPLDGAIDEVRRDSNHLLQWADDIGLEYGKGRIRIGDLYDSLQQWYVDNGVLEIEITDKGKEKYSWLEDGTRHDPLVKASRLMRQAISHIFPKAKFSDRTKDGFFVLGLRSLNFPETSNFDSFDSLGTGKEEKEGIATVSEMNQISKSMNQMYQTENEPNVPNQNGHEPNKSLHSNGFAPNEPNEPNLETITRVFTEEIKVGDRVVIAKVTQVLKANPRMPLAQQTAVYTVKAIGEDSAKCFAEGIDIYWFPLEYLGVINHE